MTPEATTIAIMGEDVPARHEEVLIDQLLFLPDNPRVYAAIREMLDFDELTSEEKQLRIYESLLQEPSVENLIPEIERDGGLQDAIIVRWDTRQVIEGNSRLAAYRKLCEKHPEDERWTKIRCLVVTKLTNDQETRLLGQAHLHGKTEWSPYAKALFCFRWVVERNNDIAALSHISGFRPSEIKKNVKVIRLMQENDDNRLSNFSYYNVLVRTRRIALEIEQNDSLHKVLLSQIKSGMLNEDNKDFTAQKMRDRLPKVIDKPRVLRKYVNGTLTLGEAYDRAKISDVEQQLKRIRGSLNDIELSDLSSLELNQVKAAQQTIRYIRRDLKRVSDMVEAKLSTKSTTL